MFMLGKQLKVAGVLLILLLSLSPQAVQGEKSTEELVLEGRSIKAQDFTENIGFIAPADVLGLIETASSDKGLDSDQDSVHELVFLPTEGKDSSSFVWEEVSTFYSGPAWYLVGRIRNTSEYAAELSLITWEVGREEKEVLAVAQGYVGFLNPGESKPFKLMQPLYTNATWYRVGVTPGFGAKPRQVELQGTAEPYLDRGINYISLLGHVTNNGLKRQDFVKVMVEFLDEYGQLLDVDWAFLNYLEPGQSQSFTVYTPRLETRKWRICFD